MNLEHPALDDLDEEPMIHSGSEDACVCVWGLYGYSRPMCDKAFVQDDDPLACSDTCGNRLDSGKLCMHDAACHGGAE